MPELSTPDLWIATVPPKVLARPVPVLGVFLAGEIEPRCPLCYAWLSFATVTRCPTCGLALDWTDWRNRRRVAWETIKAWLLDRITYEEPPSPDEMVEAGEALLDRAWETVEDASPWREILGEQPMRWLLRRWAWLRRNQ